MTTRVFIRDPEPDPRRRQECPDTWREIKPKEGENMNYYWSQGAAIFLRAPTLEDFENMQKFLEQERADLEKKLAKTCPHCGKEKT